MERLKKVLGTGVFVMLFMSMFFSFLLSLSKNMHPLDITTNICAVTQHDEIEMNNEHKILMEKNVLYTHPFPSIYEMIKEEMEEPKKANTKHLGKDIFTPPKTRSV